MGFSTWTTLGGLVTCRVVNSRYSSSGGDFLDDMIGVYAIIRIFRHYRRHWREVQICKAGNILTAHVSGIMFWSPQARII